MSTIRRIVDLLTSKMDDSFRNAILGTSQIRACVLSMIAVVFKVRFLERPFLFGIRESSLNSLEVVNFATASYSAREFLEQSRLYD